MVYNTVCVYIYIYIYITCIHVDILEQAGPKALRVPDPQEHVGRAAVVRELPEADAAALVLDFFSSLLFLSLLLTHNDIVTGMKFNVFLGIPRFV